VWPIIQPDLSSEAILLAEMLNGMDRPDKIESPEIGQG
jgi:hypothetical protein